MCLAHLGHCKHTLVSYLRLRIITSKNVSGQLTGDAKMAILSGRDILKHASCLA